MTGRERLALAGVVLAGLLAPGSAFAGTATVKNGIQGRGDTAVQWVNYAGGAEANRVTAQLAVNPVTSVGVVTLTDLAGATPGTGCVRPVPSNVTVVRCTLGNPATDVFVGTNAIQMSLGAGDDTARVVDSPTTSADLDGGPGNDVLNPGTGSGGAPDDEGIPTGAILRGGDGNDIVLGGPGDDTFDESSRGKNGSDMLDGGGGTDTVSYSGDTRARKHGVRANLDGKRNDGEPGENDQIIGVENLIGGDGNDRLTGDNGPNELTGEGGTDILSGRGADDALHAGGEFDYRASGGKTNDRLYGGAGDDILTASAGNNRLLPGTGADFVDAGRGNDRISARDKSVDDISCGRGRDRVKLDARDAIGFGCERISRRGKPRAVLTGHLSVYGSASHPYLQANASCPADYGRNCRARLDLFKGGKLIGTGKRIVKRRSSEEQVLRATLNSRGRALFTSLHGGQTKIRARVTTRVSQRRSRLISSTEPLDAGDFF